MIRPGPADFKRLRSGCITFVSPWVARVGKPIAFYITRPLHRRVVAVVHWKQGLRGNQTRWEAMMNRWTIGDPELRR